MANVANVANVNANVNEEIRVGGLDFEDAMEGIDPTPLFPNSQRGPGIIGRPMEQAAPIADINALTVAQL